MRGQQTFSAILTIAGSVISTVFGMKPKPRRGYRRAIQSEQLEIRTLLTPDAFSGLLNSVEYVSLPVEDETADLRLVEGTFDTASASLGTRQVHQGGAVYNDYQGTDWTSIVSGGAEVFGALTGTLFSAGAAIPGGNPFPNPNVSHVATTKKPNDVLYGGVKSDNLTIDHNNGVAFGGKGGDTLKVNAPYAKVFGNSGDDTFVVNSHNSFLIGGPGNDTYRLKSGAESTTIVDTSPLGTIDLSEITLSNVSVSESGRDLSLKTSDGRSVKIPQFGVLPRDAWVIKTSDGTFRIESLLRPSMSEAAIVAYAAYPENARDLGGIGLENGVRIVGATSGLEAVVWNRTSFRPTAGDVLSDGASLPDGHIVVGVVGTQTSPSLDMRDIASWPIAGLDQVGDLVDRIDPLLASGSVTNITFSGLSLGGPVSVEAAYRVALKNINIQVTAYAFNGVGVDSLAAKEYGLPNLRIEYVNYERDFLHVLGQFLGRSYPLGSRVTVIPSRPGPSPGWEANHKLEPILEHFADPEYVGWSRSIPELSDADTAVDAVPEELRTYISEYLRQFDAHWEQPVIRSFEQRFDIGDGQYVQPGWTSVSGNTAYTKGLGFGWKPGTVVPIQDRVANSDLLRDFAADRSLEFWIDVVPDSYDLTVHLADEFDRDQISVYANEEYLGELYSLSDQATTKTFRVNQIDGTLKLRLQDHGGSTKNAILNALEIKRVAPWENVEQSAAGRIDPSVVVILPGADEPVSWFDRFREIAGPIKDIVTTVVTVVTAPALTPLLVAKAAYQIANSAMALNSALQKDDPTPAWVFQAQIGVNLANAKAGLPLIDVARTAIPLTTVENTRFEDLPDLYHGQVIVIDAGRQLNDGVKPFGAFGDGVSDAAAHRRSVKHVKDQVVQSINAVSQRIMTEQNATHVDIWAVAADFAVEPMRQALDRLADHLLTRSIDHVQFDMINPIAVKETDEFFLHHPEARPYSLDVTQWIETRSDVPSDFYKDQPVDGETGGAQIQKLNSMVRQFSPDYENGQRMFRNLSSNGKYVNGEVKTEALSRNDRFLAQGTGTGYVSIFDLSDSSRLFDKRLL